MKKYIKILNKISFIFDSGKPVLVGISHSNERNGRIEVEIDYSDDELEKVRQIVAKTKIKENLLFFDVPTATMHLDGSETLFKGFIIIFGNESYL